MLCEMIQKGRGRMSDTRSQVTNSGGIRLCIRLSGKDWRSLIAIGEEEGRYPKDIVVMQIREFLNRREEEDE